EDTIEIQGVAALHGAAHSVISDRIEGGTYLIGAALTGGDVVLEQAAAEDLSTLLAELERAGAEVEVGAGDIRGRGAGGRRPRHLAPGPHPGFPPDLQAQWMVLMTQAGGDSQLRETVFENRFQHVPE